MDGEHFRASKKNVENANPNSSIEHINWADSQLLASLASPPGRVEAPKSQEKPSNATREQIATHPIVAPSHSEHHSGSDLKSYLGTAAAPASVAGYEGLFLRREVRKANGAVFKPLFKDPVGFLKSETNLGIAKEAAPIIATLAATSLARDTWALAHSHEYTQAGQSANLKSVIADGITLSGALAAYFPKTRFLSIPIETLGLSMRVSQRFPERVEKPDEHKNH